MRAVLFVFLLFPMLLSAQVNDECLSAINIPNIDNYCSGNGEFTTRGATQSNETKAECFPDSEESKDVWFTFTPREKAVFISITGDERTGGGTLRNPAISVFEGNCGALTQVNRAACGTDLVGTNVVEITLSDVKIGRTYYLKVAGRFGNTGSFKLCMRNFNPPKSPEQDCSAATLLCDNNPFYVENLVGAGQVEDLSNTCINEEFASVWYKWICEDPGTLTMKLTPNNPSDDLDFAVFRLPGGIDDCNNKELVRCMGSGETIGNSPSQNQPCFGDTGLSEQSSDVEESAGCAAGDDNYLAAINMQAGETYALIVNNFSQSGSGFAIDFGGSGTFRGPKADFDVLAELKEFKCDKTIEFTNQSTSDTDPIVSYKWDFGEGAYPSSATGEGSHKTIFDSFGNKVAALTVETSRGCVVTEVLDFFIEPCCDDFDTVEASANIVDVSCYGYTDGQVILGGQGGVPGYVYKVSNTKDITYDDLTPNPSFSGLASGSYFGYAYDTKGCPSEIEFDIEQPEEIIVNLGTDDIVADMGDKIVINAAYTPEKNNDQLSWTPLEYMECTDCLTQNLLARDNAEIKLVVTDEIGCTGEDALMLGVRKVRDIQAPNIFTPFNKDGKNDFFNVFVNKGTEGLESLQIFDRWGNMVYNGAPDPSRLDQGWDGRTSGQNVELGVYLWKARVRFLDGVVMTFSGDVIVAN